MASFALNFYSRIVEAQLRTHRKTATIRLGDKSRKYQKGMVVSVLVGERYSPRRHVFDAGVLVGLARRLDLRASLELGAEAAVKSRSPA